MEHISELLGGLTGILESQARARITNNMPETPTAIIYAGAKAYEAKEGILATLQRVWRGRAEALCQLVMNDGQYHLPLGDGSLKALTEDALQEQIDEMFAQEQSFRTMNGLLLCLIQNTADYTQIEEFQKGYLALDALKERLGMAACNTMKIVLLDESGKGRALAAEIRKYLRELLDKKDPASTSTVILSNRLKNGVLLAGDRIKENYALAGNLILLANGSNGSFTPKFSTMFPISQPHFLTASYSCIRKPDKKICEILVNAALSWLEARFSKGGLMSIDDMSKQLEITGGTMKAIERFFQQHIADSIPKREILEYLPRNTENLDSIGGLAFREFDRITMGSFGPFYENAVLAKCTSDHMKRLFRDAFVEEVHNKFSPREAAKSITSQTVEQVLKQVRCDEPSASQPAFTYMIAKAKADCCKTMLPVCEEALEEIAVTAKAHIRQVTEIIQEFQHSYMLDVDETLRQYYHNLAIDKLDNGLGQALLDAFNKTGLTKAGMLDAIHHTISLIFTSDKIFGLPLEQEMTLRMGGNGKQVQLIIQDELTDGLGDRIHLQTAIVPEIIAETILVNQRDNSGNLGIFYSYLADIFANADCLDTGNSNSIEFVQLYAFDAQIL